MKIHALPATLPTLTLTALLAGCGSTVKTISGNGPGSGAPPTVTATALQVNGVEPGNKQEVQFSEGMDASTINAQTFTVADFSGHAVSGVVAYDASYDIASFQPTPALQSDATYTATITTGAASASSAHLVAPYTYTFTTTYNTTDSYNKNPPISVNSVSPAAGATCVSATSPITITFNAAPDASTVNSTNIVVTGPGGAAIPVTMSINVTTTQVVLTPNSALPSGTISVTVQNVANLAGVTMTSPYTWSFSTACGGGGGGSGATPQYIATLEGTSGNVGQVSVDTAGNVTVQLKGAVANETFPVQFCTLAPSSQTSSTCFSIGTVNTDANGDGSMIAMFPKSGPWAGDFSMAASGTSYLTTYSPVYMSTLQPTKTVDGGILNAGINNAPQAPLTSGTITYSSSPAPNGSLTFVLTGAPPNDPYIEVDEEGLIPEGYSLGGAPTDSAGDATITVPPSGHGGDISDAGPNNGEAGWIGGFSVP